MRRESPCLYAIRVEKRPFSVGDDSETTVSAYSSKKSGGVSGRWFSISETEWFGNPGGSSGLVDVTERDEPQADKTYKSRTIENTAAAFGRRNSRIERAGIDTCN